MLDEVADQIMTRLAPDSGHQDDVAVVLYRHPAPLGISFPARVDELGRSRAALRSWLAQTRVGPDRAHDMLVAAGEAVANSIEHGHRDSPKGMIDLRATALVDQVQMTVVDTGSWKPPQPAADRHRGCGITLMQALMQDVAIHPDATGTTVHLFARIT